MIIEILFNKKQILYYIYIYVYIKKIYRDAFAGVGWEEEGDHSVTKITWSFFFILPYFLMAEPCCDTSRFSIDVVLASHQIKHLYALLLVYIYIHNVFLS